MLQQKKISNKINYDVLKDLNRTDSTPAVPAKPPESPVPSRAKRQSMTADTSVMFTGLSRWDVALIVALVSMTGQRNAVAICTVLSSVFIEAHLTFTNEM